MVYNICSGNIDGSIAAAKDLASSNIELSIPYVILIHELIHLHKLLIDFLIEKDCKDEVYELHKLNSKLEDIIAEVYLYNYIDTLLSKNNVRLNNLNDIYEKNIVQYYKSHLKWLSNIVHCVKNECKDNFPQIDHNLCSFGVWLSRDGKDIIQNNSKYLDIVKQHKNLHIIASKIKNDISKKEIEFHIVLTYLEKCEMISLSLGTELALVDKRLYKAKNSGRNRIV